MHVAVALFIGIVGGLLLCVFQRAFGGAEDEDDEDRIRQK